MRHRSGPIAKAKARLRALAIGFRLGSRGAGHRARHPDRAGRTPTARWNGHRQSRVIAPSDQARTLQAWRSRPAIALSSLSAAQARLDRQVATPTAVEPASPAVRQPSRLKLFHPQMHGPMRSPTIRAGMAAGPREPFIMRITCANLIAADDDLVLQYIEVINWLRNS
jgi:hypothetical protein